MKQHYSTIQQNTCEGCKCRDGIIEILAAEIDKQNREITQLNKQLGNVQEIAVEDFSEQGVAA